MRLSELITNEINKLLEASDGGIAEIQRNEMAAVFGCAPSQINYVLSSRFTPERGFVVESRRGGGGYIKITRVVFQGGKVIMHLINTIGDRLDEGTARAIVENLRSEGMLSGREAELFHAALSHKSYRMVPQKDRAVLRADIFKQLLLQLL